MYVCTHTHTYMCLGGDEGQWGEGKRECVCGGMEINLIDVQLANPVLPSLHCKCGSYFVMGSCHLCILKARRSAPGCASSTLGPGPTVCPGPLRTALRSILLSQTKNGRLLDVSQHVILFSHEPSTPKPVRTIFQFLSSPAKTWVTDSLCYSKTLKMRQISTRPQQSSHKGAHWEPNRISHVTYFIP
jgi:hypothetical protein